MPSILAIGLFAAATLAISHVTRYRSSLSANHEIRRLRRRLRRERQIARERQTAAIRGASALAKSLMRTVMDSHLDLATRLEASGRARILEMAAAVASGTMPPTKPGQTASRSVNVVGAPLYSHTLKPSPTRSHALLTFARSLLRAPSRLLRP